MDLSMGCMSLVLCDPDGFSGVEQRRRIPSQKQAADHGQLGLGHHIRVIEPRRKWPPLGQRNLAFCTVDGSRMQSSRKANTGLEQRIVVTKIMYVAPKIIHRAARFMKKFFCGPHFVIVSPRWPQGQLCRGLVEYSHVGRRAEQEVLDCE